VNRQIKIGFLAAFAFASAPALAHGEAFPARPIRVVVPFAAGGNTDTPIRVVARGLSEALGVAVLVENRAGAGGNIGAEFVAKAPADGYTLLACNVATHSVNSALYAKLSFDPVKDFSPISMVGTVPNVLIVKPSSPALSLSDFLASARAHPDKASLASAGVGTSQHLAIELLKSISGAPLIHVPYKGGAPALGDLLGGQVSAMVSGLTTAAPSIAAGKVRALAVTTAVRSTLFPQIPTVAESGIAGVDVGSWSALCAPAGTPATIVARLNAAMRQVLATPSTQRNLTDMGVDAAPSTPEQLADFIKAEIPKWQKVVRDAAIAPE
jgi:tripartite-type tricarboxylate transporter receptor subunit TctC